jgi:hypothetical protein
MTGTADPQTARNKPLDTNEPHFGDLRKRAFLRRLIAYRAQGNVDTNEAGLRRVQTSLAARSIAT